jgi:hypothetical protein
LLQRDVSNVSPSNVSSQTSRHGFSSAVSQAVHKRAKPSAATTRVQQVTGKQPGFLPSVLCFFGHIFLLFHVFAYEYQEDGQVDQQDAAAAGDVEGQPRPLAAHRQPGRRAACARERHQGEDHPFQYPFFLSHSVICFAGLAVSGRKDRAKKPYSPGGRKKIAPELARMKKMCYFCARSNMVVNEPSKLIIIAPEMDRVLLKVTTQYAHNRKKPNKPRSVTFDKELTVV